MAISDDHCPRCKSENIICIENTMDECSTKVTSDTKYECCDCKKIFTVETVFEAIKKTYMVDDEEDGCTILDEERKEPYRE